MTFQPLMDFNKTIMEVGNITKAAIFKSFLHLSYKNTQLLFLWTVLFNIFMRQTLTDDFCGLHKNMNCAFPLKYKKILCRTENFRGILFIKFKTQFLRRINGFLYCQSVID